MREIKFRVYSPLGKKFLNSYKNKGLSFLNGSDKDMDEFGSYPLDQCFDLGFIVQQYTGLTDKNGKEIFEGDIVQIGYGEYTGAFGKVIFKFGAYMLESNGGYIFQDTYKSVSYGEVIGNIFETKNCFNEIPQEVKNAAIFLGNYFKKQGIDNWTLYDVSSRK